MKKLNIISLLVLTGCASTVGSLGLDHLNRGNNGFLKNVTPLTSCEMLKETSYDVFYSDENKKCVETAKQELNMAESKLEKAKTDSEKLSAFQSMSAASEKISNCRATKDLTLAELNPSENRALVNYNIVIYYERAYHICRNLDIFEANKVKNLTKGYRDMAELQKIIFHQNERLAELEKLTGNKKKVDDKLNEFLAKIGSDPILSKLKQTAPDFTKSKLTAMNYECPLVYYIESLHNLGSFANSDLASASNYKFSKKDANTLVMKVGDMEYTFVKAKGDIVNVAIIKGKNKRGVLETSKNTFGNNWHATEICLQHPNMH